METTATKRKVELAFGERICLTAFFLLVCFVVSIHDLIPHTHHGKVLTYAVKILGEDVASYFNHHPTERFEVFESVRIGHSEWKDIPGIPFTHTDDHVQEVFLPESHTGRTSRTFYYTSIAVGSNQLRAPPMV